MLNGKKIELVAFEKKDMQLLHKWNNDPEVIKYFRDPEPESTEQEKKWFERLVEKENAKTFTVILDKQPIGVIYLSQIDWRDRNARLSIIIGEKDKWGKGYGTDAVLTLVEFAFEELNLHRIELDVFAVNKKAIRCYEKAGFAVEGIKKDKFFLDGKYIDCPIMARLNNMHSKKS